MARRGGRRGRRSRSKQRSRGAGTRSSKAKSSKSRSRNTRGSGARKSAPSKRRNTRTTTRASNRRATVSKKRQATRSAPKRAVNASRGKAPTSRRQATRTTRQASPTRTNTRVASYDNRQFKSVPATGVRGDRPASKSFIDAATGRNVKPSTPNNIFGLALNTITGMNAAQAQPMNTRPKMLANLPKDYKQQEQALSAAADASRYKSLSIDQQREIQQGKYGETFGLNPVTQRNEINRIQNMIKAQNAARVRQGLDPTFSGQSLKEARDADGDGFADNMGNRIAGVYNATLGRLGLPNMPKQTVAGANISMNRPMGQRLPGLVRRRGSSGGASRIQQQAAATQMQPEIAPTIGQPIEETGAAPTVTGGGAEDLTRIQSQAYNTQLTSSLAGMFGGQGSVGYTPQGDQALSPTLRAGQSRGRRRVRLFGARRRRGGTGDQFSRAGDRIAKLTNINV